MNLSIAAFVSPQLRQEFFDADALRRLREAAADLGGQLRWFDNQDLRTLTPERTADLQHTRVLISSWGTPRLDLHLLENLPQLELLAHTGASVRPFVSSELFDRDIAVTQAGLAMARPVAEVALAFTLALLHRFDVFDHSLHDGAPWEQAEDARARHEISASRIGVVGASRTGRAYITMVQALGGEVVVYDPVLDTAEADELGVQQIDLPTLLKTSQVVALHAPSLPETHHMIGATELALMADGAILVNVARSWLVDEAALIAELSSRRLHAGLDVFDAEPLPMDHPFRSLDQVLLTPHHAAATVEGRLRQGEIVVEEIERLVAGAPLHHIIKETDLEHMA